MGLAERRAVKEFESKRYPELKGKIDAAATFELQVEVRWDTLAVDDCAHLYDETFSKVYFEPLVEALNNVAVDEMGKDALKAGLQRVVIQNVGGFYSPSSWAQLEAGILTLDHQPCTNVDDGKARALAIQTLLEKAL